MPYHNDLGYWLPDLKPKQMELYNNHSRFLLVNGPKLAGKTIAALHALVRHCWENPGAHAVVVAKTLTVAKDGGCWADLVDTVLPEWMKADIGLEFVKTPRHDIQTKKMYFVLGKPDGSTAKVQLDSCENENEVKAKFNGKKYSFIFINELSNFERHETWRMISSALRSVSIPDDRLQMICDTNPADDGERNWIYEQWYKFRVLDHARVCQLEEQRFGKRTGQLLWTQQHLDLIEFTIHDNLWLSPGQIAAEAGKWSISQDLYDRYFLGKWVMSSSGALFHDVFKPLLHVVGEMPSIGKENPPRMVPQEDCFELASGWDLGGFTNHAIVIVEKVMWQGKSHFKVLDELVILGQNARLEDICFDFVVKMKFWEDLTGKRPLWRHYSDKDAFDRQATDSELMRYKEIYKLTKQRVDLRAAEKYAGSVEDRLRLLRRLLYEDRITISAFCPHIIQMLQSLKKGRGTSAVDKMSPLKHAFDALTYYLLSECANEVVMDNESEVKQTSSQLITLRL